MGTPLTAWVLWPCHHECPSAISLRKCSATTTELPEYARFGVALLTELPGKGLAGILAGSDMLKRARALVQAPEEGKPESIGIRRIDVNACPVSRAVPPVFFWGQLGRPRDREIAR